MNGWIKRWGIGWGIAIIWMLGVAWIAFFWNLGSVGLVDETEPLFAEAARQMVVTGDWITPYFNGATRFDKPPLIYWFMAVAYQLIGVNEWAVRLPSTLAGLGLTGFGFYILYRFGILPPLTDPHLGSQAGSQPESQAGSQPGSQSGSQYTDQASDHYLDQGSQATQDPQPLQDGGVTPDRQARQDLQRTLMTAEAGDRIRTSDFKIRSSRDPWPEESPGSEATEDPEDLQRIQTTSQTQPGSSFGPNPAGIQIPCAGWVAGFGAALIALNPLTFVWGRAGVSDMLLTTCIGSALFSFFLGYAQPDRPRIQTRWYLLFYTCLALGTLTKGIVAIVLPGLAIGSFLIYLNNWRQVSREIRLLPGALIVLALTVPWFAAITWIHGMDYVESFFGYHNLERFVSVVNQHSAPWYFYFLIVLIGFLPFSIDLPLALLRLKLWQPHYWRHQPRSRQLGLLLGWWWISVFVFFSIAVTKLPSYVLPLIPASACLVALLWHERITHSEPTFWKLYRVGTGITGLGLIMFCLALAGLGGSLPSILGPDTSAPNLSNAIQTAGLPIALMIIWGGAALASGIMLLFRRGRWLWVVSLIASISFISLAVTNAIFVLDTERQLPLRQLAAVVDETALPGEGIVMAGMMKPSLVFYSERPILFLSTVQEWEDLIQDPRAEGFAVSVDPNTSGSTVLLIGTESDLAALELEGNDQTQLATADPYHLRRVTRPTPTAHYPNRS